MSYDGSIVFYTAAERETHAHLEDWWTDFEALTDRIGDAKLAGAVVNLACDLGNRTLYAVHARLCRMLPHVADVVTLACFPDEMPVPARLQITGEPPPVVYPARKGGDAAAGRAGAAGVGVAD